MPLVCTHILCVDVPEVKWGDRDGGLGGDGEYVGAEAGTDSLEPQRETKEEILEVVSEDRVDEGSSPRCKEK